MVLSFSFSVLLFLLPPPSLEIFLPRPCTGQIVFLLASFFSGRVQFYYHFIKLDFRI